MTERETLLYQLCVEIYFCLTERGATTRQEIANRIAPIKGRIITAGMISWALTYIRNPRNGWEFTIPHVPHGRDFVPGTERYIIVPLPTSNLPKPIILRPMRNRMLSGVRARVSKFSAEAINANYALQQGMPYMDDLTPKVRAMLEMFIYELSYIQQKARYLQEELDQAV
jgi:hypothetical protein